MNKKIVFLDVDGTLCNDEGLVPNSARHVKLLEKMVIMFFYVLDVHRAELYDFIMEVGFDGVIGAGGGFVTIGDETLYHKRVSNDDVKHLVDYFEANDVDFYLESNGGLYASKNLSSSFRVTIVW